MLILERHDSAAPPQAEAPEEVTIQAWKMETDAEQRQFIEAHIHGMGIHRVQLEFWSANKPALHLYRAFGFSSIDETEIAVGRYV
jgi:hypothetical protein